MEQASRTGQLVRAEAQYQLHIVYLWYEQRFIDALALVRGLQERYPRNPLFRQIEAEILGGYVHDTAASLAASEELLDDAEHGEVNRADLAEVRARVNIGGAARSPGRARSCARHARQPARKPSDRAARCRRPRERCSARGPRGSPLQIWRVRADNSVVERKSGLAKTRAVDNHKTLCA